MSSLEYASAEDRKGFVKKVYGILCIQLTFTACFTIYPTTLNEVDRAEMLLWAREHMWITIVTAILALVVECAIFCLPDVARAVPTNYICLAIFTACETYLVYFASLTKSAEVVLMAMFMTAAIVLSLTLYAMFTSSDFTIMGGSIAMVGMSIFMLGLFAIILHSSFLYKFYVFCVILLVGFYIIVDTQIIVGKGKYGLSEDDYIIGALILYIDIIVLFLYLLRALGDN